MPRYFLHLRNDLDVPDAEGVDLPDLRAAIADATEQARFTISQTALDEAKINLSHRIDIEDEHGQVLKTVYFRDVVMLEG